MNLTSSTTSRPAFLPRLPLARLVACLLFCFLTLKVAGASAADNSLLQRANSGDPQAEDQIGYDYEKGLAGYPLNMTEAAKWYRKGAEQGQANAQIGLALMYEHGTGGLPKNNERARYWFVEAANQGDPWGAYDMGICYSQGLCAPKDYRQAYVWFKKAADQNFAAAQYAIGNLYENGWGVPADHQEALAWDRKAADLGMAQAQVQLGLAYQFGTGGLPQSYENAGYWYMKAAAQGDAWGEFDISVCYDQGTCEPEDYGQEYMWAKKAADQNLPRAECTVAGLYLHGWGVRADRQQAQNWFEKAGGAKGCDGVDSRFWAPLASAPATGPHFLPCQIAQNADRPCTNQEQSYVSAGVDSGLVGTWEIVTPTPAGNARWVWEIHRDGTYRFHAEGPGAVPGHSGTFAASQGHYVLNSTTTNWNDTGTYQLTDRATLFARGKLGPGTWHRVQPKVTGHGETQRITVRK